MKRNTTLGGLVGLWGLLVASIAGAASSRDQCQPHWCFKTMLPESCVGSPVCPILIPRPDDAVWTRVYPRELSEGFERTAAESDTFPAALVGALVAPR